MSKVKLPAIYISRYFNEVKTELKKVSWPSKNDTVQMTLLVISVSAIVSFYLGGVDYLFTKVMSMLLN